MFEQRAACVPEDIVIAVRLLEPSIRAASPPDFSWTGSRECRLLPRSGRCDGVKYEPTTHQRILARGLPVDEVAETAQRPVKVVQFG